MRFFHFSEMPYPYIPEDYYERYGSARVTLPRSLVNPHLAHDLYKRYLDEYTFASEAGFDLMINEHHQTMTCIDVSIGVTASALIQRTNKGKILMLGYQIANENPVHVAEEVAMLDTISGGRILCGFVRGVGMETHPSNVNPVFNRERFYEAHDLILKAWTSGETFNWEGKHFQYRYVNVWPPTFQQPYPEIWTTGGSDKENIQWIAKNKYHFAVLFAGFNQAASVFDMYREHSREIGLGEPEPSRFAYACLCYTAETDEQAEKEGKQLWWYLKTKEPYWFRKPPGYTPVSDRKKIFQSGTMSAHREATWEQLKEWGMVIVGSPDTVAKRIKAYYETTGGASLILMNQAGFLPHELTLKSLRLFSEEVMPQVKHLGEEKKRETIGL
ncbi:LLM class flavin-dependent oxidoreductase [Brevibacillus centrosporus]|jgi:alkanesulfonate monooxygenase SsuD/methylene tetrahydromethanopterin reductase-like flavin-dependent oxidoreductase (luciferase family)|uniref:LLM class flavin-dependent oxidoreductase n=1 Tax=Brevibacillus centrosporus TaxID=54910 RepID=UPI002E1F5262|nr:LLM class flavin-dependent oxidoreductase [Brevibacillus centrosporus]